MLFFHDISDSVLSANFSMSILLSISHLGHLLVYVRLVHRLLILSLFFLGKKRVLASVVVVVVFFFFYHRITRNDKPHTFHLHRFQCKRKHSQPNISHALQKIQYTEINNNDNNNWMTKSIKTNTCKSTKAKRNDKARKSRKSKRKRTKKVPKHESEEQLWVGCVSVPFWFNALSFYRYHRAVLSAYKHQHEHRNNILAVIVSSFPCIRFWVTFYALQWYFPHTCSARQRRERRLKRQMRRRSYGRFSFIFSPSSEAIKKTQFGDVFIAVL